MTTCNDVYGYLTQVSNRAVSSALPPADAQQLSEIGLVRFVPADEYRQLSEEVQTLGAAQAGIAQEMAQRARLAGDLQHEEHETHSVLFHLHGKDKQTEEIQQETRDQASMGALDTDLSAKEKAFSDLVEKRSLLDTLVPTGDQYVGLTGTGTVELRNLGVRLYRFGDTDFATYWKQYQQIGTDLSTLADRGATYFARLAPSLVDADRSYLWAISIGLARAQPDPDSGTARFADAYNSLGLAGNSENRLMASEILFALSRPITDSEPLLARLVPAVRSAGVPPEAALGVAAILLFGQRADGTAPTQNLNGFLRLTRSFESAALLAINDVPFDELSTKFQSLRSLFGGWGYEPSEDVELSSAYLAVSELPVDGMATKLSIVARGLSSYLQYPLVAASILSSIPTLEANETLNLLEQAYGIVGRRAVGLSQTELICLAVRMVHSIRDELVGTLDSTATQTAGPARAPGAYYGARAVYLPVIVAHNTYYSVYSGVGGAHPGHVHGFAGGGLGGG